MAEPVTLSIEYRRPSDIVGAVRNPKLHDLPELRRAVARFGYVEPVMEDGRTGRLIAGHGRTETVAALAASAEAIAAEFPDEAIEPPRGIHEDEHGAWLMPVVVGWASTDDAEAEGYIIAANRLVERGGWHNPTLASMLDELRAEVADVAGAPDPFAGLGYVAADLDVLMAALQQGDTPTPTNPEDEWTNMPDFNQEDRQSAAAVHVHFADEAAATKFAREVLGLDRLPRSTWWPTSDGLVGSDQTSAWVADAPAT